MGDPPGSPFLKASHDYIAVVMMFIGPNKEG
jgi:hypothetical protein